MGLLSGALNLVTGGASGLISKVAGSVVGGVKGMMANRANRKQDERNTRAKLLKAGIDERSNGWKDEAALAIVVAPFLAAFYPGLGPHIQAGFDVIRTSTPEWYQYLLSGGLASAMGLSIFSKAKK